MLAGTREHTGGRHEGFLHFIWCGIKLNEQLGEGQSRAHSWLGWISSETVEFLSVYEACAVSDLLLSKQRACPKA